MAYYDFDRQLKNLLAREWERSELGKLEVAMQGFLAIVEFLESNKATLSGFLEEVSIDQSESIEDFLDDLRRNCLSNEDEAEE